MPSRRRARPGPASPSPRHRAGCPSQSVFYFVHDRLDALAAEVLGLVDDGIDRGIGIVGRQQEGLADKPFEVWSGVQNPSQDSHKRLQEAGVTMTNGTNFLDDKGQTRHSSIDEKKRKLESFAKKFLHN